VTDLAGVLRAAAAETGLEFDGTGARPVGGGCISAAWELGSSAGPVFLKIHAGGDSGMFEAEAAGLVLLGGATGLRAPGVLGFGTAGDDAWLLLEWIEPGPPRGDTEAALGRGLAAQHRTSAERFGWERDNWIGATPQDNTPTANWADFFALNRLGVQLDLLEVSGIGGGLVARGRRLVEGVPALLSGHAPSPALLHGDLWGGNWATDTDGQPFVFDPAVYFGDREADLAMTRLFGGFGPAFYAAYEAAWPLPEGASQRRHLYNLYHVLNHVNLFGAGYLRQADSMVAGLLAELG